VCEYVFGDSITGLTETADGVHVTFERSAPRTFDLVVGADGIHSNARRLAFGPESDYVKHLGYYYCLADVHGWDGPRAVMYNEPGRMAAVGGSKAPAFFVFASAPLEFDRYDTEQQKKLVMDAYRDAGWRVPELISLVPDSTNFYLDSISQTHVEHYSRGRVVLLGDSAYGNTLGGFGTGLAIVAAYVLAGELQAADGDHRVAFQRYEESFKGYAKIAKQGGAGPFLAPPSRLRMWLRDSMFRSRFLLRMLLKLTDQYATDIELKDY
jgi:2-polyprenyl-6-methoxyphenol hydroxylase-like FAD-dependent oxidoreductase